MITPEDREAGLPHSALSKLHAWGGEPPQPVAGGSQSMTGQLCRLGWRILPIPMFKPTDARDGDIPPTISFTLGNEWLILPPEDSPIRARKVAGKVTAIRTAWGLATLAAMGDATQPGGEG